MKKTASTKNQSARRILLQYHGARRPRISHRQLGGRRRPRGARCWPRAPPPRRSHGRPRAPLHARARFSSTASASASSITRDTSSSVAALPTLSNSATSSDRKIRLSSFASNLQNTRSISSFVSAGTGVASAEDDDSAFLSDGMMVCCPPWSRTARTRRHTCRRRPRAAPAEQGEKRGGGCACKMNSCSVEKRRSDKNDLFS
jgi:hypothetical protein